MTDGLNFLEGGRVGLPPITVTLTFPKVIVYKHYYLGPKLSGIAHTASALYYVLYKLQTTCSFISDGCEYKEPCFGAYINEKILKIIR